MLIRLFERGYRRKFDFFYMPIDYNVHMSLSRTTVMWAMPSSTSLAASSYRSSTCSSTTIAGTSSTPTRSATFATHASRALPSWPNISRIPVFSSREIGDVGPSLASNHCLPASTHWWTSRSRRNSSNLTTSNTTDWIFLNGWIELFDKPYYYKYDGSLISLKALRLQFLLETSRHANDAVIHGHTLYELLFANSSPISLPPHKI